MAESTYATKNTYNLSLDKTKLNDYALFCGYVNAQIITVFTVIV